MPIQRDLHISKEIPQVLKKTFQTDQYTSTKPYIYETRSTCVKRDLHMSKETTYESPIYINKTLHIRNKTHIFQKKTYISSIKTHQRDHLILKKNYTTETIFFLCILKYFQRDNAYI